MIFIETKTSGVTGDSSVIFLEGSFLLQIGGCEMTSEKSGKGTKMVTKIRYSRC